MWERTLQDLIRGLRANKQDENKFIAKAIEEIRAEIRTDDMHLKAGAILKLTYVGSLLYFIYHVDMLIRLARDAGLRHGLGRLPCR
jgi:hypothetical protein